MQHLSGENYTKKSHTNFVDYVTDIFVLKKLVRNIVSTVISKSMKSIQIQKNYPHSRNTEINI